MEEAKTDSRIAKIIERQSSIVETIDDRSLSKENYKKLKTRLGQIVNELYHDEKRHHSKINLPKLSNGNTSSLSKHPKHAE
jgi:hypothetical protein